jgi:hypothetical protein
VLRDRMHITECPVSFVLPKGATLEDLAGHLASLHVGTPVAINVKLDS